MKLPKWAMPVESMSDEDMRFAIEAADVLDFMHRGFTREQHVACFKSDYQGQAAQDWDRVQELVAR